MIENLGNIRCRGTILSYFTIIIYYFKIIIIIISLYNINLLFFNVETLIYNLQSKKELIKIENYLNFCTKIKKLKTFKKIYNPIISIISPVFNRERFLIRFIGSIQYQSFNNIEIIFVDDCSIDENVKIIDEYKQKDGRIILIKNKKNKGTFQARNLGVIYSRGKYLIIPDPDDIHIILKRIL